MESKISKHIVDSGSLSKEIPLPFWMCFFLKTTNSTFPTLQNDAFYTCKLAIRYILETECRIRDSLMLPCGYWICVGVGAVIVLLANFGIFSNILNLLILPKSLKGSTVKRLMVLLAIFDLLAAICAIPVTCLLLLILGRYENRMGALEAFSILFLLFSLGRTGSIFVTIMIAIERYIAVAFPFKTWRSPKKSRIQLVILIVIITLVNLPWWLNKTLDWNETYARIEESGNYSSDLSEFPFIYKGTAFSRNIYSKVRLFHIFIDFAFPFPLLLAFNGFLYRSIFLSNKARQTLTTSQRREVNAAKMFSIVVFMLLMCHSVAVVIFILTQVRRVTFRELQFFQILATTLNASVNFVIYYVFGKSFRGEFWTLIRACKLFPAKVEMNGVTPLSSTIGTIEMGVTSNKARSIKKPQQQQHMQMNNMNM